MKRKLLLGSLTAASALCLAFGIAACGGGGDDGQIGFAYEYDRARDAYAITGMINLPDADDAENPLPPAITIPAEYRGDPVFVGEGAFAGYTFLKEVTFENGVIAIDANAFAGCTSLSSVKLSADLTEIGEGAFANCAALKKIEIPGSVNAIGKSAFFECTALSEITVGATSAAYTVSSGILFNKNQTEIVHVPAALAGEVTLPATLSEVGAKAFYDRNLITKVAVAAATEIGEGAFAECDALLEVVLPAGLTTIGEGAFANSTVLGKVELPAGLTTIGAGAFTNCSALTEMNVPDSVTEVAANAFAFCSGITEARLPSGLTELANGLFEGCGKLEEVTMPAGITFIGSFAFADCVSLKAIDLPAKVEKIGERAFFGCSSLMSITVAAENTVFEAAGNCLIEKATKTLLLGCNTSVLPDGVEVIAPYAFRFSAELTTLNIPASVKTLGDWALIGCTALRSIIVADENETFYSHDGILYAVSTTGKGEQAKTVYEFVHVPFALTGEVEIPQGIKSIPNDTFKFRSAVTKIVLPEGITSIGESAFAHCEKLEEITIPANVSSIGVSAFAYCTSLTEITIPDSTPDDKGNITSTSVANFAFCGCSALKNVYIGDGVNTLYANDFSGCDALETITVAAANKNYASRNGVLYSIRISGEKTTFTGIIHAPMMVAGEIALPETLTAINATAFYGRTGITAVVIPSSVTSVGSYAFFGCTGLTIVAYAGTEENWAKVSVADGNDLMVQLLAFNA